MSHPTRAITGPTYPLLQQQRAAEAELKRQMSANTPILERMYGAHQEHGISHLSVVRRDGTWIGPTEEHQHLVQSMPHEYFIIGGRRWDGPQGKAAIYGLCADIHRQVLDLAARIRAARETVGMATIVLAVLAARDLVTWDTDESITRAAWRLCLAAAEREPLASDGLTPARVWRGVLEMLDVATTGDLLADGRRYAEEWLTRRGELRTALAERGIEWGGRPLSRVDVVEWLGITGPTWRAYISRGQAPGPDDSDSWQPATVSAYRIASQRGAEWWLGTVRASA